MLQLGHSARQTTILQARQTYIHVAMLHVCYVIGMIVSGHVRESGAAGIDKAMVHASIM